MKAKEVMKILKISRVTLCKYVKIGKIRVKTMPNKTYLYNQDDVYGLLGLESPRMNVIYARVSSYHQKQSLETQIATLTECVNSRGICVDKAYSDISSGLHLSRKSLMSLVADIQAYKVKCVYVLYKDRLARVSFDMLEKLFMSYGTRIEIINKHNNPTLEQELCEDIVSLIHSFSMKQYSRRKLAKTIQES